MKIVAIKCYNNNENKNILEHKNEFDFKNLCGKIKR